MPEGQVFLIQSSGSPAEHSIFSFSDRTFADEVMKHLYYRHENWHISSRDRDFGKVKLGDYVLHYCTGDVESNPRQIRNLYEVIGIEKIEEDVSLSLRQGKITKEQAESLIQHPHILRLKLHLSLRRGLELSLIRTWVGEGRLSKKMKNCGQLGFDICQVEKTDYDSIVEWNKSLPAEPSVTIGSIMEEEVRRYVAALESLEAVLGPTYAGYKLYSGEDGKTGELYDTEVVGEIDLLYQNQESGDFLVVELKRTEDTSDSVVGQIGRYLGWVGDNLAKERNVRGLIIVRSASEELRYAVKALRDCQLATYDLVFRFHAVR